MYSKTIITFLLMISLANTLPDTVAKLSEQLQVNLTSSFEKCQKIKFIHNLFYIPERKIDLPGVPSDMSVHYDTGDVYFTLVTDTMKMRLAILHRSTGEIDFIKVPGIGQTNTIDNVRSIVYLGTDKGLYKFENGKLEPYGTVEEDILYIAAASDGNVYVTTWPKNLVLKISDNGTSINIYENIPSGQALTIDHRDNFYFADGRTTYILKRGHTAPIKISGLPQNQTVALFVSYKKDVYAMDSIGNIYSIDIDAAAAKHLGSFKVNDINAFAVDTDDNVLIGTNGSIMVYYAYLKNPCLKLNKMMRRLKINLQKEDDDDE